MKWIIFTACTVVVIVLFNLQNIVLEHHLTKTTAPSEGDVKWVNSYRNKTDITLISESYDYAIVHENNDALEVTYNIDTDTQEILIIGVVTAGKYSKDVYAKANYRIEGRVIEYYNTQGHVSMFPREGQVLSFTTDNKLVLSGPTKSVTSL